MTRRRVGVVVHPRADVAVSLRTVAEWCATHDVELVARTADAAQLGDTAVTLLDEREFGTTVEAAVSLGGDGTMLGAMRTFVDRPVPVLGVNHGTLGFLVEVQPPELPEALQRLVDEKFELELYPCLRATVRHDGGPEVDLVGFNDVVLAQRGGSDAVQVRLSVDGAEHGDYRCDALVVATPTGSTAYNYAAGGPVLSPAAPAMVVTPVAPMSGISRPIVLGEAEHITVQMRSGHGVAVEGDGVRATTVSAGDVVSVQVEPQAGHVVRLDPRRHGQVSSLKLSLLDVPLGRDQLLELVPPEVRDAFQHLYRPRG